MSDGDRLGLALGQLGQTVRLGAKPWRGSGYVVAVMLIAPYEAFVRWTGGEATFEALDDLVNAHGRTLTELQGPELGAQRLGTLQGVLGSQQFAVSLPLRIHEPPDTRGVG